MWHRWSLSWLAHSRKELQPKSCLHLPQHFPVSFLISSLLIMSLPLPPIQYSIPLAHLALTSQHSAPHHTAPGSILVSTALQSGVFCPCIVCTGECRRDPAAPSICLPGTELAHKQLGVTMPREVLCLGYIAHTAVFSEWRVQASQDRELRDAVSINLQFKVLNS